MLDIYALKSLLHGRRRTRPVHLCDVDDILANALNVTHPLVLLSWDTIRKQKRRHPEIKPREYRQIPRIIQTGIVVQDTPKSLILIQTHDKRPKRFYRLSIKATLLGDAIFVTSFHRLSIRKIKIILRRHPVVRETTPVLIRIGPPKNPT